mgnify:CR=1 FL=1
MATTKVIKIIALTDRQTLISEIEEIAAIDIGQPDCKLINPFLIKTSDEKITIKDGVLSLSPWLLSITKDDSFMISSDKILTICEPMPTLLEKYLDLIK